MSIHIAHRRKKYGSNALNVPSTVQKETTRDTTIVTLERQ